MRLDVVLEWFAWIQVVASIPALVVFMFLTTKGQIVLLGIVTMITWTATGLSHVSSARAAKAAVLIQQSDVEVNVEQAP